MTEGRLVCFLREAVVMHTFPVKGRKGEKGAPRNRYTLERLKQIALFSFEDKAKQPAVRIALRRYVDLLLYHHHIFRSEETRKAELTDLHVVNFPDEGESDCPCMVLIFRQSKVNERAPYKYTGAIRNKDSFLCPLGAMAMYLSHRFGREEGHKSEFFPSFSKSEDWFDIKLLLRSQDPKPELSYIT